MVLSGVFLHQSQTNLVEFLPTTYDRVDFLLVNGSTSSRSDSTGRSGRFTAAVGLRSKAASQGGSWLQHVNSVRAATI